MIIVGNTFPRPFLKNSRSPTVQGAPPEKMKTLLKIFLRLTLIFVGLPWNLDLLLINKKAVFLIWSSLRRSDQKRVRRQVNQVRSIARYVSSRKLDQGKYLIYWKSSSFQNFPSIVTWIHHYIPHMLGCMWLIRTMLKND